MGRGEEGRWGFVWGIPSERAGWDPASPPLGPPAMGLSSAPAQGAGFRCEREEVKVSVQSLGKLYVRNECHDQVLHIGWIIKVQN